jgi:drug/metabolite transporter (DMT)-like permease
MTALVFGLLAAVAGGVSVTLLGHATRRIGPVLTASWTGVFGIVLGPAAAVAIHGVPHADGADWLTAFAAGGCSLIGNALFLFAVDRGQVAVVAPIVASSGGLAAAAAVASGTPLSSALAFGGAALTAGVVIVARRPAPSSEVTATRGESPLPSVLMAASSAIALAFSYLLIARTQDRIGSVWAYAGLMVLVIATWTIPQALRRKLAVRRRELTWVLGGELAGIAVFLTYGRAAADNRAVAAVVYGQYAVVAVLIAVLVFHERLSRSHLFGIALAVIGTTILSLTRA